MATDPPRGPPERLRVFAPLIAGRDIPSPGARQSRTANYDAAGRAATMAGLRHCVALIYVLGGLHVAVSPGSASVHPSQEWLADRLGCAVSTVRAQLDALVDAGVLCRAVSRPVQRADGTYTRATNRYWINLRRVWGRIRAGRTYRRSIGALSPLRGVKHVGGPVLGPPPPSMSAPPPLFDPPEPPFDPDEAERGRVHAAIAAMRGARCR